MAPSKQAAASKACSTGAQAGAAVGGGARRRDRALLDDGRPTQRGTVARFDLARLTYVITLDEAMDESGRRGVNVTEDKLEPEAAEDNESAA